MSLAYYIVLDNDEPGFETFVNGKAVAHSAEELDTLCGHLGLPILESFMGQSLDDLEDLLGEDLDIPDGEDGEAKWFAPRDGVAMITPLISHLKNHPDAFPSAEDVLEDLEEYRAVLEQADSIGAKWHLAMDM